MEIKKIGGYGYIQGINSKNAEKVNRGKNGKDKVDFSATLEIKKLFYESKNIPEVREKLVNELKQAIENGTFKIDPEKIARSILGG
ncbi:negative regulator of flagellin synthesis FlgM [Thermosipho japonicus]|uniref:Negative regulator of flagellin synthesis n=1 Tax=Thermosipho japonicus TaxID=90323 RepID=A0A841GS38_9BACT|nr:flagellar biosynthesis anti-sigma factor FlgM [Thermosipho japonicus]MBB6062529.1 negative regulator of flagellin synthesis FlgM [Thermosipho japonicus]